MVAIGAPPEPEAAAATPAFGGGDTGCLEGQRGQRHADGGQRGTT
jgi:hypothetical protein